MSRPPGVPPLLGDVQDLFLTATDVLSFDTLTGYGAGAAPLWGVFRGGVPVVVADTVTSFDYKQEWSIADYPVERGGFESYDKVNTPFIVQTRFVSGGSETNRQKLLDSIVAIGDLLTLYDVVTPEAVYVGVNMQGYRYRREAQNGLGLMIVDVTWLEIREEGVTDYKNAKVASAYSTAPQGNVQSLSSQSSLPPVM